MEIKPGSGSSIINVVGKWDAQGGLVVGDQVRVRILSVQGNLAVISLQGQEILVSTALPFEPGTLVNLRYEGINAEGKHTFRMAGRQGTATEPAAFPAYEVLRQFGLETAPELLSRLESYLRLAAGDVAHAPVEYGAPGPEAHTKDSDRQAELFRQSAEQFVLLAKAGIPLSSTNLRIWHQFWREPAAAEALSRLLLAAEEQDGEERESLMRLVNDLFVSVETADPQNLRLQLAKWLKPQPAAEKPELEGETGADRGAGVKSGAPFRDLENALVRLVEQYGALKTVNAAGARFCPDSRPLYFLIPMAYGTNAFAVEILVEERHPKRGRTPKKQRDLLLSLAIPTANLGRIIAVIAMRADSLALELVSDSPETVGLLRKHLDQSGLKEVFHSVKVRQRKLEKHEPKNRLLALVKQQIAPQIDLWI